MKVAVIGAKGGMGRRYCQILSEMNITPVKIDLIWPVIDYSLITHFVVATPTDSHAAVVAKIVSKVGGSPKILCEKPLARIRPDIDSLCDQPNVFMVNNYNYLPVDKINNDVNRSMYQYYNSGKDGLIWDCVQIIHMAEAEVFLSNNCAVWQCMINGTWVDKRLIDISYVKMIYDFLGDGNKLWSAKSLLETHYRIYGRSKTKHIGSDTGQIHIEETA